MMIDARTIDGDVRADVCVVGAGAAGIAAALEFEAAGLDVALVVGGGDGEEARYEDLNRTRQVGIQTDPTEHNTVRGFGGTTSLWGGWCRPLDATDFEKRPGVPGSGWPFGRETLEPHFARAFDLCGVAPPPPDPPGPVCDSVSLRHVNFRTGPPRRFGPHFQPALAASRRIRVLMDASAVEIEPDPLGRRIVAVKAATLAGRRFAIQARCFVLACGTIQNARLLLCSRALNHAGIGNDRDLVGRFFSQHPAHNGLLLTFAPDAGLSLRAPMALAPDVLRQEQLINCHFLLYAQPDFPSRPGLPGRLRRPSGQRDHLEEQSALSADVGRALGGFAFNSRGERDTALIYAKLAIRPEQVPNAESRITVDDADRDELGTPRAVMDWRLTPLDWQGAERAARILAAAVGAAGIGRLRAPGGIAGVEQPASLHGGHHHYGTTRMHPDPRRGVVDADCRVHGIANLFVAGGSVFPTVGYANPMVTMLSLTVRLARHIIDRRLAREGPSIP